MVTGRLPGPVRHQQFDRDGIGRSRWGTGVNRQVEVDARINSAEHGVRGRRTGHRRMDGVTKVVGVVGREVGRGPGVRREAAVATRFPSGVTSEIEPSVAETPVSARERADTPTVGAPDENSPRTMPFDHEDGAIPQDVVGVAAVTAGDSRMSRLTARVIAPTPTQVLGGRGSAQPRPTVVDVIDFPMSARASPSFWSKDEIDWSKDAGSRPKQVGPGFEETLDPLVPEPFSVRDEQSDHS